MKAILCRSLDGPGALALVDMDPPALGPGQVRIAVHAVGINFADTLMVRGRYQVKAEPPFVPGSEFSGEVIEVAADVTGIVPGQRVMALGLGAMAEQAVVPATAVHAVPEGMSYAEAAAFPVAYGTSHVALTRRAGLKAGETLLVFGAAGGVGLTAVEIGKRLGATVIACASSAEKLELAASRGADHLIDYTQEDLRARVKALGGADVVYDTIGGDAFHAALKAIKWEGRILVVGFASGDIPQIPANHLLVKNVSVSGIFWGAYRQNDPEVIARSQAELAEWYAAGALKPHVSAVVPFDRAGDALAALENRTSTGKTVVAVVAT